MNKFKLFLAALVAIVSGLLAAAKLVLTEVHDFWLFVQHLQW